MEKKQNSAEGSKTLRSAMVITLIIIVSKVVGFLRELVFAAYFGTGILSDAYTNANTIVNLFILLFSACISSTFIPIYTKTLREEGKRRANRYTNSILTIFTLCGVALGLLGYFFAPQMCELLMPQLAPAAQKGTELYASQYEKLMLTASLAKIMFPSMAFAACTGVFTSLLNANERFIPEQIIGFALSFCVITACVAFTDAGITAVAIATAITYVLQLLIVLPFTRGIYRFEPNLSGCSGKVKRTFALALPAILSMALDEVNHLVDKNVGIWLGDGPNSALNYAYRLITLVLGVLVVPITTIMFSKLSQYAARGEKRRILDTTKECLEVLAVIVLPVMVLAALQSRDVIRFLYFRGAFDENSLAMTSDAFFFYIIGVLGFAWRNFLVRVFYSVQDTSAPMRIGILSVGVNILLNVPLAKVMGVGGLTLATSISGALGAALMLARLRRTMGRMRFGDTLLQLCKLVVAVSMAGAVTLALSGVIELATRSLFLRLLGATAGGLAVYAGMVVMLRVRQVKTIVSMIRGRVRRS